MLGGQKQQMGLRRSFRSRQGELQERRRQTGVWMVGRGLPQETGQGWVWWKGEGCPRRWVGGGGGGARVQPGLAIHCASSRASP